MPTTIDTQGLPAQLARWTIQLLGMPAPVERHATCSSCAMCDAGTGPAGLQRILFSPRTRCCTYRPQLSNHAAGQLLGTPELRAQFDLRVAAGEATPMGLRVDPSYQLLYRHATADAFGRAESLQCPHQADDGACGIWDQRPTVCATWFCKHERGAIGRDFWAALRECLSAAERALALWCLQELGFDGQGCARALRAFDDDCFDAPALDQRPAPGQQALLWGHWLGREVEFYRACAERVTPLDWPTIEALGGASLAALAAQAREAARAQAEWSLPSKLVAGSFQVLGASEGKLWLRTYSEFDPLEVSPDVLALVARGDGVDADTLTQAHVAAGGQRPTLQQLRLLVDFGVMKASSSD